MPSLAIILLTIGLCLSGGFQQGYIASVLNQPYVFIQQFVNETIQERFGVVPEENVLNVIWSSLNIMFPIASIFGQFFAAWMCKKFGRKVTAIITCVLYVPGTLLCSLSYYIRSFELLFLGRLLWSLSNGINAVNVTVWIVECAPTGMRGGAAALQEFSMAAGSVLCQAVGIPFTNATDWPFVFLPNIPIVVFSAIMFALVPDSPVSILQRERDETKARAALARYYGVPESNALVVDEINARSKSLVSIDSIPEDDASARSDEHLVETSRKRKGIMWIFNPWATISERESVIRWAAWLGVVVKIAYVFTGARCLRSYSTYVMHGMAHFSLDQALYGSFIIGLLRIPATLIPVLLVDKLGRRPLLLSSTAISVLAIGAMMAAILIGEDLKILTFVAFCVLLVANGAGLGSISRFYAAELVPRSLLIDAVSILAGLEAFAKIVVEFLFYPIGNVIGAWTLLVFLVPTVAFLIFMWATCPESSGKDVYEVLDDIAQNKKLAVRFENSKA